MKNTDKQTITNLINRIEQLTDDPEQALDWMYQGAQYLASKQATKLLHDALTTYRKGLVL